MIEVEHVAKSYRRGSETTPVLKDVTLRIRRGEFLAIMGASGSGKTTLLNILGCLDKPTSGRYSLDGIDVSELGDDELSALRNDKIGFIFQQFFLLDRTTSIQNVLLPLIYAEEYPEDATKRAEQALRGVGLEDRFHYRANELSGGEQQRVAIARALINDPAVVLADEPTGNLDSKSTAEVMRVLARLHDEGRTIVVVTHDQEVAQNAERIIQLEDGRLPT